MEWLASLPLGSALHAESSLAVPQAPLGLGLPLELDLVLAQLAPPPRPLSPPLLDSGESPHDFELQTRYALES